MDIEESELMWNKYTDNNGMIIKSSDKDLEASVLSDMKGYRFLIVYKPVEYHEDNFIDTVTTTDTHYFIKSTKSKQDNEFRARIIAEKQGENINMPVDLNTLIKGLLFIRTLT